MNEDQISISKTIKEYKWQKIIGASKEIQSVYNSIKKVASKNVSILILGETGTGKELIANAIHANSERYNGPLVKVYCNALSENLLESELFGHVKGAFTGAIKNKIGKFELANRGTIFLDEIGEINRNIQIKLLRVLQEKEIERVGENRVRKIDIRIIAATNINLKEEVKKGNFREDLYYRLNTYTIQVPLLVERIEDLQDLCEHFIRCYSKIYNKKIFITAEVMKAFSSYTWPGNIRELEHAIEFSIINSEDNIIKFSDLPNDIIDFFNNNDSEKSYNIVRSNNKNEEQILKALKASGWNKSKASRSLNIGRTTLWRFMKQYCIDDPSKFEHKTCVL